MVIVGAKCRIKYVEPMLGRGRVVDNLSVCSIQTPPTFKSMTQIVGVKMPKGEMLYFKPDKKGVWVTTEKNHTGRWTLTKDAVLEFL